MTSLWAGGAERRQVAETVTRGRQPRCCCQRRRTADLTQARGRASLTKATTLCCSYIYIHHTRARTHSLYSPSSSTHQTHPAFTHPHPAAGGLGGGVHTRRMYIYLLPDYRRSTTYWIVECAVRDVHAARGARAMHGPITLTAYDTIFGSKSELGPGERRTHTSQARQASLPPGPGSCMSVELIWSNRARLPFVVCVHTHASGSAMLCSCGRS